MAPSLRYGAPGSAGVSPASHHPFLWTRTASPGIAGVPPASHHPCRRTRTSAFPGLTSLTLPSGVV